MPFSLQARIVFPVERPPIEHGVVTIDGERIVAIGQHGERRGEIHDLGDVALLPGLVNTHTHLEFSQRLRPLGVSGMQLPSWIRLIIAERQHTAADSHAVNTGLRESLRHGVTTMGEISTAIEAQKYLSDPPTELNLFLEVIGFSRARAESALAAVTERLEVMQSLASGGRVHLGISPHAPYTVSPDLVRRLVALSIERNLPVAMHLAESEAELQLLSHGTGPFQQLLDDRSMWDPQTIPHCSRPLDYLKLLAAAPRALVIHGNYLDEAERLFLAQHADRMSLVYCPRTHVYFDHPPYPLAQLLATGVNVTLGTDSRASNPDLSLLNEMRHIAHSHPEIEPHEILRLGTMAGALALGRAEECGSLLPGKFANLVAVPLPETYQRAPREMLGAILATDVTPTTVFLRGQEIPIAGVS